MQTLRIIDTIGPFASVDGKHISNWSKNPFENLEEKDGLNKRKCKNVLTSFEEYLRKVADIGYNAVTIDDLPHLITHEFYSPELKNLLHDYKNLYQQLFTLVKKYGLLIFVNVDYMFYNNEIKMYLKEKRKSVEKFFYETVENALQQYPAIDGINMRIGEHDADTKNQFVSKLTLRTPEKANLFLKRILPLFEKYDKTLLFRTWTVGVYNIGDLMWNKKTFDTVFSSITSPNLIISMKYGDTDFFRYLSLNPLFFHGNHKKIIELQTRREWEGMGLYPSFVGWDYEKYLNKLQTSKNFVGISVWCQTGGWTHSPWKNLTFLKNSSFWNELNTYVTIKIYSEKKSVEKAIVDFCNIKGIQNTKAFIQLLKHAEVAIKKGLYIKEFASKAIYFRRVRIPSLVWVAWDTIAVSSLTRALFLHTIKNTEKTIAEGYTALKAVRQMISIGKRIKLEKSLIHSLEFELETLTILIHVRRLLFSSLHEEEKAMVKKQIAKYIKKYPEHYTVQIHTWEQKIRKTKKATIALYLTIRSQMTYRIIDRIFLYISPIQKYIITQYIKRFSPYVSQQAMGVDVLFA
jgi:hypothetical protein